MTTTTTTTTESPSADAADRELKARHRALWAAGDYPAVADVIAPLGPRLVDALGVDGDIDLLDVGAGAGNAAVPAARRGARVVASDLTPELLDVGRARAQRDGLDIDWQVADAEHLPYHDDSFDVVTSCVGVMFAPHHAQAAGELVRVCRPGGRIGLINWTPTGFIGELFTTMKPFAPTPPPGASPAPLWGDEAHVRELFGDTVADVACTTERLRVDRFATGGEFRDFFKATYGPTIVTYRNIADDEERVAQLDRAIAELADRYLAAGAMEWEYLLILATLKEWAV